MPTALVATPRHRAWMPKSRTGCKTCKIRKIKCDEAKPHCRRCTSTGRTCDGYDSNFAPARTSPKRTSSQSTSPPALGRDAVDFAAEIGSFSVLSYLVPSLHLETADERISFQFFVTHAGPALSGCFDSSFWQRQVLQAAHQQAAVQHCLIALGAMYRRFYECTSSHIDGDISNQHFQFAIDQSNKAIRELVRQRAPDGGQNLLDKLTVMTCCVLFGSMANLQGQQQAALEHLRSGMRMLREAKSQNHDDTDRHPIELDSLHSIFTGLDIHARSSMNWSEIHQWEPALGSRHTSVVVDTIQNTYTLSDLHPHVEILLNDTLEFNRGCVARPFCDRDSIQTSYQFLIDRFQLISRKLNTFHTTSPTPDSPSRALTATLLLHAQTHHYLRAAISPLKRHFKVSGSLELTPYEPSTHFKHMMSLIKTLISHTPPSTPVYTTSPGPLSALWLVATSAPSPCVALRKHAVELMLAHPRREGLFDGQLAGKIGQEAWKLEQTAAQQALGLGEAHTEDLAVPEHLRMAFVHISYAQEQHTAIVKLANGQEMKTGGGTVVRIEW